jgi:hypothetical protein
VAWLERRGEGGVSAFERFCEVLEGADCRRGRAWLCPTHEDRNASLSVSEGDDGRVLVKCHAGCRTEDIVAKLGLRMRDLFEPSGGEGGRRGYDNRATAQHPLGCTIEQYAEAKRLPVDFLRSVGVSDYTDSRWPGAKVLRIPYRDLGGRELSVRIRVALDGAQRFLWRKGSKPMLYGLDRLDRNADEVVLVEGESDCHTLWHHGFSAVGLPGADCWNGTRDAPQLANIGRIYVVVEPDRGGDTVMGWLGEAAIRDRAWIVQLGEHKDASRLHLADP